MLSHSRVNHMPSRSVDYMIAEYVFESLGELMCVSLLRNNRSRVNHMLGCSRVNRILGRSRVNHMPSRSVDRMIASYGNEFAT
jgi:hypothetical protein